MPPSVESFAALPPTPPPPPPLPPPAQVPTNVVSFCREPTSWEEASVSVSMSDGTYVRQQDDDPMTMILLSHRDSATAELTLRAMEEDLNDGT